MAIGALGVVATIGAERSFVTAFLRRMPLVMSEFKVPCVILAEKEDRDGSIRGQRRVLLLFRRLQKMEGVVGAAAAEVVELA